MAKVKGYIFSRKFMEERVPQNIQNLTIKNYCITNKLLLQMSAVEYTMDGSYIILRNLFNDLNSIDGLIFYSLFQLPIDDNERNNICKFILQKKKKIFFSIENIVLKDLKSLNYINDIWNIKKIIPSTLQNL